MWGSAYATPVILSLVDKDTWQGQLLPLDDGESMYVKIQSEESDSLTALFRNPERNLGKYVGKRKLRLIGDEILFGSQNGKDIMRGRYDKQSGILSVYFPTESATFDFTKRTHPEATGFSQSSWSESYVYCQPLSMKDGWQTASLEDVGIDPKAMSKLIQSIIDTGVVDVNDPNIQ